MLSDERPQGRYLRKLRAGGKQVGTESLKAKTSGLGQQATCQTKQGSKSRGSYRSVRNRRMRNRTYGGVRGRREQSLLLLDFAFALAGSMGKGMLLFIVCYIANRFLLAYKKENMPGFLKRWLYKIGLPIWGSYSKGLGSNKIYLGDNQPSWAGREKFMHNLRLRIAEARKNGNA